MITDDQKMELLRNAVPSNTYKDQENLLHPRSIPEQTKQWPVFTRSSTTQIKTYERDIPSQAQAAMSQQLKTTAHPWKISLRNKDGNYQYKIEVNSFLYDGLTNDKINVESVGDDWSTANLGHYFLQGTFDAERNVEAKVVHKDENTSLEKIELEDTDDGKVQKNFSVPIAFIYDDNGSWKLFQMVYQQFTLMSVCKNGIPCVYPMAL